MLKLGGGGGWEGEGYNDSKYIVIFSFLTTKFSSKSFF